jgi:hypothetical protein
MTDGFDGNAQNIEAAIVPTVNAYQDDCTTPDADEPTKTVVQTLITLQIGAGAATGFTRYIAIVEILVDGNYQRVFYGQADIADDSDNRCCVTGDSLGFPNSITFSDYGIDAGLNPDPLYLGGTVTVSLSDCPVGGEFAP